MKMIACRQDQELEPGVRLRDRQPSFQQCLTAQDREHGREQREPTKQPAHHRCGLRGENHCLLVRFQSSVRAWNANNEGAGSADRADSVAVVMPSRITASTTR